MAAKKTITYLVSYDLGGKDRDYGPVIKAMKELRAKKLLKSQWTYECDEGTTAKQVSETVLKVVNASGQGNQVPPVFEPLTDKLLVSPFFPRKGNVIHLVAGGKDQPL